MRHTISNMHIHLHTYTHTHTYIHTHIHTYIHTHIHIRTQDGIMHTPIDMAQSHTYRLLVTVKQCKTM